MKIKICGLRQPENIAAIARLPVDYLGFIFYPESPRYVSGDKLPKWLRASAGNIPQQRVGVFVNAEIDQVLNAVHDYQLDYVQLHGNESPAYCQELNLLWTVNTVRSARLIKAFSVDEDFDFDTTASYAAYCPYFLFDTRGPEKGGTGRQFNWQLLQQYEGVTPFFLSGGIGPDDAAAIRRFQHPQLHGIDLNSRFESEPGIKDTAALHEFLTAVETA